MSLRSGCREPRSWSFARTSSATSRFVRLLGDRARCFASRDFTDDELVDPFAHGEAIGWTHQDRLGGCCQGGLMLALLVTDGTLVARLDALWDTWSE